MINWKEMSELHVISKLEQILNKWFGVELFFTDHHYKIRSKHIDMDYKFNNHLMKIQMQMKYGYEYVGQDIEKVTDHLMEHKENTYLFDSFFPHTKGIAAKVEVEGEVSGAVFAYPFILDTITEQEIKELKDKLVECGASVQEASMAVDNMKRMSLTDIEYLQELVDLVAEEVTTFHEEISKREERIQELNSELGDKYRYHSMIGKAKNMQMIYRLLDKIAASESSVFIMGENGTGKELVAKAIHFYSPRKDAPFYAVNCSAFNDNLLDSELFGHVKGAFTGAVKDKKGLFEVAHAGTLFLDEIGDTSLSMQVKLLRVLQEGTYMPVGAPSPRKADVRIIAATNRNLKEMMAKGEFREDLFYRINVINVNIPPLRDRAEDIPLLIEHFLNKRCAEQGVSNKNLSKKTMEKLLDYPWPGNVRELENEIERLVVLAGDDKSITPDILSPRILDHGSQSVGSNRGINTNGSLKAALEELESLMIREGLKRCNFNKSKLSKELGVSRASLIMKVEKYGLDKRKQAAGE
jgi:two-component system response regulator HupR/HoxA